MKISLCMIVKNEEKYLERCLNSVRTLVDEIIIVDTGSSDKTIAIAKKFTSKIYNYDWNNDFAAARNFSFSKAKHEYIMWLDADDVFPQNQLQLFLKMKENLNENFIKIKYITKIDKDGNHKESIYRARIVKRGKYHWEGKVHEVIPVNYSDSHLVWEEIFILHNPDEYKIKPLYLKIFEEIENQEQFDDRMFYHYGRELMLNKNYDKAILIFLKIKKNSFYEIKKNYYIGECFYYQQKYLEAINYLLKISVKNSDICCTIAKCYLKLKDYLQSIFWYQSALINNNFIINKNHCNFIPFLNLGYIFLIKKNYNKAYFYLKNAQKIDPLNESVINYLNYLKKIKGEIV